MPDRFGWGVRAREVIAKFDPRTDSALLNNFDTFMSYSDSVGSKLIELGETGSINYQM